MDNDAFNNKPTGMDEPASTQPSEPTLRPLQEVGAKYAQPADSEAAAPESNAPEEPVFRDKPPKSPTLIGVICGIGGLLVGGAGIYGLMQLINKPGAGCAAECDCSNCSTGGNAVSTLTTSFLTLEPQGQNMIYSPLSIRYGLSLLDKGAAGSTKDQITKVLGDGALPRYNNVADKLSLANAVFVRDTYADSVLPSYKDAITQDYDAEIILDNFANSNNMDSWVSNKTFGLINQIGIQPTPDTEMVLANALAIQMDWQDQFDTDDTNGRSFYKEDGTEIEATTMSETTTYKGISYYQDDQTTMLSLPLRPVGDTTLEFVAVMPSGSLTDYLNSFDLSTIEQNLSASTPASTPEAGVYITIPKFKFEYQLDFKNDLQSLGIRQAFTDSANFSNMTSNPQGLKVSDAVHKANIDFSEDGIKAAAVTAFAMMETSAAEGDAPKPVVIKIDHPFLFLIRDQADGTVWFAGTVYEPNLWADDSSAYQSWPY